MINISKPKFARPENVGLNDFLSLTFTALKSVDISNRKVEKTEKISGTKTTINSIGGGRNPGEQNLEVTEQSSVYIQNK